MHDRESLHHRYAVLLVLILLLLAFQLAATDGDAARVTTVVLQALVLLTAVITSRAHPWVIRATVAVCFSAVIGALVAVIGTNEPVDDSGHLISFMLIALTPPVIVNGLYKHFREHSHVTRETMYGVLCIYLLIGMVFAATFSLAQSLSNEEFFVDATGNTSDFLYFSYSTLSTTGYGDLIAATSLGRSLSITEALIGQIYLVTVVALIVGNVRTAARRA